MTLEFEDKKLLEETARLARENNDMLKKIRRGQKWARGWRIAYWVIIIGVAVGAFYFLQPYVEALRESYVKAQSTLQNFKGIFQENVSPSTP